MLRVRRLRTLSLAKWCGGEELLKTIESELAGISNQVAKLETKLAHVSEAHLVDIKNMEVERMEHNTKLEELLTREFENLQSQLAKQREKHETKTQETKRRQVERQAFMAFATGYSWMAVAVCLGMIVVTLQ
ncbi:hypothetical protein BASA81_007567 [Batrachochytrium salamandrivorans]|nr:hypothetical protein BASA81_007567 [Batrachochytrium salamandrivorans]